MATQEQLELRKKWVEALRSGDYQQGKGALNSEGCYCCLGVLCEVAGVEWVDGSEEGNNIFKNVLGVRTKDQHGKNYVERLALPPEIQKLVGMTNNDGTFVTVEGDDEFDDECTSLTDLNDDGEKTFTEIADLIESNPKGLFVD